MHRGICYFSFSWPLPHLSQRSSSSFLFTTTLLIGRSITCLLPVHRNVFLGNHWKRRTYHRKRSCQKSCQSLVSDHSSKNKHLFPLQVWHSQSVSFLLKLQYTKINTFPTLLFGFCEKPVKITVWILVASQSFWHTSHIILIAALEHHLTFQLL